MTPNAINQSTQQPKQVQTVQTACALGSKGARVFRLRPGDKRPRLRGSFKNATSDLALIATQFQPDENVGAATGHEFGGGLVALDIDVPRDSGGIPLAQTVVALRLLKLFATVVGEQQSADLINNTLWVRTSSGGWQLWFLAEQGAFLVSRDHLDLSGFDPDGVHGPASDDTSCDTRGEGGYAVAPGSVTVERTEAREDGSIKIKQAAGPYQAYWRCQPVAPSDLPDFSLLPLLPAALIEEINALPIEGTSKRIDARAPLGGAAAVPGVQIPADSVLNAAPTNAVQSPAESATLGFTHRAPKNPQRIRGALSHSISRAPNRYKARHNWLEVMTALAGACVTGELTEVEADSIYEWFCKNTPGSKNENESQWSKTKGLARDRLRNSEEVRGCKSITDQAAADGWVDPNPANLVHDNGGRAIKVQCDWPGRAKKTRDGERVPLDNPANAGAMLDAMGFRARLITRGYFHEVWVPDEYATAGLVAGWQALDDCAERQLTDLVIKGGIPSAKIATVSQGVKTLGDRVHFDPFKHMLEGLAPWDGVHRTEDFPSRYMGAAPAPITAAYVKHTLMLLMARTYEPGCKADEMLVLIGKQGTSKSTALRILVGDEAFTDAVTLSDSAKEIIEMTQRAALVEVSEMIGLTGKGAEKNKATISRQEDRARLAYGASPTHAKRSFIWAGSSNDSELFNDPTGARRFMPIKVGNIDTAAIERDRPQILAEARHKFLSQFGGDARRVKLDPKWWQAAKAETEKYRTVDPWEDTIAAILVDERERLRVWSDPSGKQGYFLSSNELLDRLLPPGYNKTGAQSQNLSKVMQRLGFVKHRPQIDGKRQTGYFRPFTLEDVAWRNAQVQTGKQVDQGQGLSLAARLSVV